MEIGQVVCGDFGGQRDASALVVCRRHHEAVGLGDVGGQRPETDSPLRGESVGGEPAFDESDGGEFVRYVPRAQDAIDVGSTSTASPDCDTQGRVRTSLEDVREVGRDAVVVSRIEFRPAEPLGQPGGARGGGCRREGASRGSSIAGLPTGVAESERSELRGFGSKSAALGGQGNDAALHRRGGRAARSGYRETGRLVWRWRVLCRERQQTDA